MVSAGFAVQINSTLTSNQNGLIKIVVRGTVLFSFRVRVLPGSDTRGIALKSSPAYRSHQQHEHRVFPTIKRASNA